MSKNKAQIETVEEMMPPAFQDTHDRVTLALKSYSPFIWVRSHEEKRVIDAILKSAADKDVLNMDVYCWSLWQGLVRASDAINGMRASGTNEGTWNPSKALEKIAELKRKDSNRGTIVIMRDAHAVLQEPIPRNLRDIYYLLIANKTKLVFISPVISHGAGGTQDGLPPTLEKQFTIMDYDLPSFEAINKFTTGLISETISFTEEKIAKGETISANIRDTLTNIKALTNETFTEASRALQGLTEIEIKNAVQASLQHAKSLNVRFLLEAKKQILAKSEILEYWEPNHSMGEVGGLDLLKSYLEDYKYSHTQEAKDFGVQPLRGVLILGVPGTGKSLTCKALSSSWKLPLVRLDVGKVMGSLVGQSEQRMRAAVKQIESVAPALLWIDEVEKALSGTKSSNSSDGGTMSRVFGTLLTAMEEGLKGITILATANDIEQLPPEFIRRFSEVFYVDLPGPDERKEIFEIHIKKKKRDMKDFDLQALIEASENFTGHEIAKAIDRSLAFAFKTSERKLKTEHILDSLQETKPISHIMAGKIDKMRSEARDKYRYASSWAAEQHKKVKTRKEKMKVGDVKLPDMKASSKTRSEVGSDNIDLE